MAIVGRGDGQRPCPICGRTADLATATAGARGGNGRGHAGTACGRIGAGGGNWQSASRPGNGHGPRCASSREAGSCTSSCLRCARVEDYLQPGFGRRTNGGRVGNAGRHRRLSPPHDHRLQNIKLTPDPGVLEINVHPASNWNELVGITTTLYEEARSCAPGGRKIHARRAAHRHLRRQPHRARRGRRRPTARSCAAPTCCGAWSATGTTILR